MDKDTVRMLWRQTLEQDADKVIRIRGQQAAVHYLATRVPQRTRTMYRTTTAVLFALAAVGVQPEFIHIANSAANNINFFNFCPLTRGLP